MQTSLRFMLLPIILLIVVACASGHIQYSDAGAPQNFPIDLYQQVQQKGKKVYQIDAQQSHILIYAYKGGALAKLGHDHVIASHHVTGYIVKDGAASQADVYLPLNLLTVDEANLRAQAGFTSQPTQADIEGTRQHMLGGVLQVNQYPFVTLHVKQLTQVDAHTIAQVVLTLHGVTQALEIPLTTYTVTDHTMKVEGKFSINQTDFGITPFAVMGGLLQVTNKINLTFDITAQKLNK